MNETAGEKQASDGGSRVTPSSVATYAVTPVSFVVGVTDIEILRNNFMASPCVTKAASPHEVILVRGGPNVTAKLSRGLEQAKHGWVVCIHQDVWLLPGFPGHHTQLRNPINKCVVSPETRNSGTPPIIVYGVPGTRG